MPPTSGDGVMAIIRGTNFGDNLTGTSGNDTIYGFAGNDTITGGDGRDILDGGNGNDTFVITSQAQLIAGETYRGGTGTDYINITLHPL